MAQRVVLEDLLRTRPLEVYDTVTVRVINRLPERREERRGNPHRPPR